MSLPLSRHFTHGSSVNYANRVSHLYRDLDRSKPHRFVLLDIPLVIWWDANASAWRVFEDVCPHRLVPLRWVPP